MQWGHARVNSFITKGKGTWGKADSDLAAKVRAKEEVETEGLWDNIRKKRERIKRGSGERMRKKGDKGAPTADQIRKAKVNEHDGLSVDDRIKAHQRLQTKHSKAGNIR